MPVNYNTDWPGINRTRRYPLAADASAVDTTGTFTIPDDWLVELQLPVHAGLDVDPSRFFIASIGVYASGYTLIVAYQPETGDPVNVATAIIPVTGFARNTVYALGGMAPYDDTMGKVTIGSLDSIVLQPPGLWTFTLDETRLDVDAIRPIIRGVSSLSVLNGAQSSPRITGDIVLVAGSNCQIGVNLAEGQDPQIVIGFVEGAGTVTPCTCTGDVSQPVPLVSFMGINPASSGDFTILGSNCIQVVPIANGIQLIDTCSQPCCGCSELERLTQDISSLDEQRVQVQEFVSRLQISVDTMNQIVLGSKLSDRGCFGS